MFPWRASNRELGGAPRKKRKGNRCSIKVDHGDALVHTLPSKGRAGSKRLSVGSRVLKGSLRREPKNHGRYGTSGLVEKPSGLSYSTPRSESRWNDNWRKLPPLGGKAKGAQIGDGRGISPWGRGTRPIYQRWSWGGFKIMVTDRE